MIDAGQKISLKRLFTSWKDVANYLGKTTRTVQRWEKHLGLPIHRPPDQPGVILANSDEIDEWIRGCRLLPIATHSVKPGTLPRPSGGSLPRAHALVIESIARQDTSSETLELLVRAIELELQCKFASILLLDKGKQRLIHAAGPNVPKPYKQAVDGLKIGLHQGSCGTAAFLGETVVAENVFEDEGWTNFCALARKHDFAACWSTPILTITKEVIGTFAIYYSKPHLPDASEVHAMRLACDLAAIVMQSQFQNYMNNANHRSGFMAVAEDWTLTAVNDEATRLLERSRGSLLGKNLWDIFPKALGSLSHSEYERALRENVTVFFETFSESLAETFLVTAHPYKGGLSIFFRAKDRLHHMAKATADSFNPISM
ncbi:MAG: diguanylate cyclase with sensor [Acidobacteriales bacterium]|nr:diguanylate cyclase with sensor [Terriglobales bacterium]